VSVIKRPCYGDAGGCVMGMQVVVISKSNYSQQKGITREQKKRKQKRQLKHHTSSKNERKFVIHL
jgi:hypothetical protein